jgi:hypothetical protein
LDKHCITVRNTGKNKRVNVFALVKNINLIFSDFLIPPKSNVLMQVLIKIIEKISMNYWVDRRARSGRSISICRVDFSENMHYSISVLVLIKKCHPLNFSDRKKAHSTSEDLVA